MGKGAYKIFDKVAMHHASFGMIDGEQAYVSYRKIIITYLPDFITMETDSFEMLIHFTGN